MTREEMTEIADKAADKAIKEMLLALGIDAYSPDEIKEEIKSRKGAEEAFGRMLEHLARNEINLHETPLTLGTYLKMDPVAERFIDNEAANDMLTRNYRKPYVVPEIV